MYLEAFLEMIEKGREDENNRMNPQNYVSQICNNFATNLKNKKWDIVKNNKTKLLENLWDDNSFQIDWKNHDYIVSQIKELEDKKEYFAQWNNGKIYLIEIPTALWKKKILVIKCQLRDSAQWNKRTLDEYHYYLQSHNVIKSQNNDLIKIPKTYGVINDDIGNVMIMMDYVPWMTVFALKTSIILPILYKKLEEEIWIENTLKYLWNIDNYNNLKTDKEIKAAALKILDTFYFNNNQSEFYNTYLDFYDRYRSSSSYWWIMMETRISRIFDSLADEYNLWFIESDGIEKIQDSLIETFDLLHSNKIYHNDLNSRNIIIWEDGKIYIIDFDKSSNTPFVRDIKLSSMLWDPKYSKKFKWKSVEWDFKVIYHFDKFFKKAQ